MKIAGYILAGFIALAILQYVVAVALALLAISLLWGVWFRPRATFSLLLTILVFGLVGSHPLACIVVAGVVTALSVLTRRRDTRKKTGGRGSSPPPALPAPPRGGVWPAGGRDGAGDG